MAELFTDPIWQQRKAPKSNKLAQSQHAQLLRLYGSKAPRTCGECEHLIDDGDYRRTYFKCSKAHVSSSASTDWRKKYEACGQFQQKDTNQ